MLKFAFIMNIPGESPETFSAVYENEESYNLVVGTGSMDMAKDYLKKLVDDGFTLINLCGDFDDEITAEMQQIAGEGVKIRHADYMPEELDKLEKLQSMKEYGVVIVMRGVEESYELTIKNPECNADVIFVKDMPQAKIAARKLVADGIDFIELCSWFDKVKTIEVVESIKGAVPVGTCGEL